MTRSPTRKDSSSSQNNSKQLKKRRTIQSSSSGDEMDIIGHEPVTKKDMHDMHLQLMATIQGMAAQIQELTTKIITPLQAIIDTLAARVDKLEKASASVSLMKDPISNLEKKRTLIITGITETGTETPADLHNQIMDLTKAMKIKDFDYDECFRLGKAKNGKRPILLRLLRTRDKFALFNNKKNLKGNAKYGKVYINEDKSPEERQQEAHLRRYLREQRAANPKITGIIRNGTLTLKLDNQFHKKMMWTSDGFKDAQ
jgi:hypothetical protein